MKRFWSLFLFALLFIPFFAKAETPSIVISEIAWAGSSASNADEWVELFNSTGEDIDISGWSLSGAASGGEALVFPDASIISASSTFIVSNYESGNEKTVLDIESNWVTTSVSLSNSALYLELLDSEGGLVDLAGAPDESPLAGNSGENKTTMERVFPVVSGEFAHAWLSSENEFGTPEIVTIYEEETVNIEEEEEEVEIVAKKPSVPVDPLKTSVKISEIYSAPTSGEKEWIELTNISSIGEFLDGWTLEDASGKSTELNGLIIPWTKKVIEAPAGKLNNPGDIVFLKDRRGRIIDALSYGKTAFTGFPYGKAPKKGESLMRVGLTDNFLVTATPTKGEENIYTDPNPPPAPPTIKPKKIGVPIVVKTISIVKSSVKKPKTVISVPKKVVAKKKTAPKKTKAKYKGRFYKAWVAVPPGVYSKARMRVIVDGQLHELRITRSPSTKFVPGEEIGFIAQTKTDGGTEYLLANIKTLYKTGVSEDIVFSPSVNWPEETGAYELTGKVKEVHGKEIEVDVGNVTGLVSSPTSIKDAGLVLGDIIAVKGFYQKGDIPKFLLADASSLKIVEPFAPIKDSPGKTSKLPLPLMLILTFSVLFAGVMVYLRQERIKRLMLSENENTPF